MIWHQHAKLWRHLKTLQRKSKYIKSSTWKKTCGRNTWRVQPVSRSFTGVQPWVPIRVAARGGSIPGSSNRGSDWGQQIKPGWAKDGEAPEVSDGPDGMNQIREALEISDGQLAGIEEDSVLESPRRSTMKKMLNWDIWSLTTRSCGAFLCISHCRGSELWTSPEKIRLRDRSDEVWKLSSPVSHFDLFLSHTWKSKGRWKVLALVFQTGYLHGLIGWFFGVSLLLCLQGFDIVGPTWTAAVLVSGEELTCGVSQWTIIAGGVSMILGLCLSPYLPFKTHMCFLDVACIHQGQPELFERGVYSIGGCLSVAKELRVLYSPKYLSSLWCIFELVGFRKANPTGKLNFKPLFIERSAMICGFIWWFFWLALQAAIALPQAEFRQANILLVFLGVFLLPTTLMTYALRQNYREKSQLISDLKDFDLDRLICTSEFDRGFILTAIYAWFGNSEAIRDFVRGPLRDELLGLFPSPQLPYEYMALILSSSIAWILESVLHLYKAGAESHQLVIFFLCPILPTASVGLGLAVAAYFSSVTRPLSRVVLASLIWPKRWGVAAGINAWAMLGLAWLLVTARSENTLAIVSYVAFSALIPLIPGLIICQRRASNRRWTKQNLIWSTEKGRRG